MFNGHSRVCVLASLTGWLAGSLSYSSSNGFHKEQDGHNNSLCTRVARGSRAIRRSAARVEHGISLGSALRTHLNSRMVPSDSRLSISAMTSSPPSLPPRMHAA